MPSYQRWMRRYMDSSNVLLKLIYKCLFVWAREKNMMDLSIDTKIEGGLYLGHPKCITISPLAIIGKNVNINKGAAIGKENRGKRKGAPTIGNDVWIGINAVVVGNITIGNDVLIAPGAYVNCDVPDHSIVVGNPCMIKHQDNATEGYIENRV